MISNNIQDITKTNKKIKFLPKDWLKIFTSAITLFLIIALISVVGFIFYLSAPLLEKEGINFIWQDKWVPKENKFGIFNFIVSTFWTILFTMLLVVFLNLFASLFISKFLPQKIKSILLFCIQFLSGLPSICFGLFGAFVFVDLFLELGIQQPHSMMTVILVLTIMVLPTTIILSVNAFDGVSKKYELSAYALGVNKVTVAFKIVKKICSKSLWIILFFGFCRAIGEVTAISLIAGNGPNMPPLDQGFVPFFFSSITTLSSLIGLEIGESLNIAHESSLFSVAGFLICIVLVVNLLIGFYLNVRLPVFFRSNKITHLWINKSRKIFNWSWTARYLYFWHRLLYWFRYISMVGAFLFVMAFYVWILGDITWKGIVHFQFSHLIATKGDVGLLSVILGTFLLVIATVLFSTPLALLVAIFLVFYGRNNYWMQKITDFLNFFIYQFSSAPTIIFGIFGLALFVSMFNFGFSILSAALTMILIVLPIMIQTIKQNLEAFPQTQYHSAIALGLSRRSVILRLILPTTLFSIIIAIIFGINKTISESSPILITMGSTVMFPKRAIFSGGRTLSTHMYLLQADTLTSNVEGLAYQTALITLILLFILNFLIRLFSLRQKKQNKLI